MMEQVEILYDMEEYSLIKVPLGKIEQNPLNPNSMDATSINDLKHSLQKFGYLEFIVVVKQPTNDKYVIVDGAHRALAMREMGKTANDKIEVILAKKLTLSDAYFGSYAFNKAKGRISPEMMESYLRYGDAHFGTGEIINKTGLTEDYVDECLHRVQQETQQPVVDSRPFRILSDAELAGARQEFRPVPMTDQQTRDRIVQPTPRPVEPVATNEMKLLFVVELLQSKHSYVIKILHRFDEDLAEALVKICKKVEEHGLQ